jgi:hypothetical protein
VNTRDVDDPVRAGAFGALEELAISTHCGFAAVAAANPGTPERQRAKLELVARPGREAWS